MSNTKIWTTPIFDHPLLSPDLSVENLDTVGKSFYIQAKEVFYKIILVFLVLRGSTKGIIGVHNYLKISYCLNFLCICSLGDCVQMVKNIFFLKVIHFPYHS